MGFGFISLAFFTVAFIVFIFAAFIGNTGSFFSSGEPTTGGYIGMFVLSPVIAAFGAALPARALGAGWLRSLLASAIAVVAFIWSFLQESELLLVIATALAPTVVVLVASAGSGIGMTGVLAVLAASAVILIVVTLGFAVGGEAVLVAFFTGWVVLPAVAGLFQPRRDGEERSS